MTDDELDEMIRQKAKTVEDLDDIFGGIDERIVEAEEKVFKWSSALGACKSALLKCLENAERPYHLKEWVEFAKTDRNGRKLYADQIFEPETVREAVLNLVKSRRVRRLGQMSFYSVKVENRLERIMCRLLDFPMIICDLETLAEMILEDAEEDLFVQKVQGFLELDILLRTVKESEVLTQNADGNVFHYSLIAVCSAYAKQAVEGRLIGSVTPDEFFKTVRRATVSDSKNFDCCDAKRSIKTIQSLMIEPFVQESVIENLKNNVIEVVGGKIKLAKQKDKLDRFSSLDDE